MSFVLLVFSVVHTAPFLMMTEREGTGNPCTGAHTTAHMLDWRGQNVREDPQAGKEALEHGLAARRD